jgi:endoglucanase
MTNGLVRVAARRTHGGFWLTLFCLLGVLALSAGVRAAGTGYWHTSGNQILDANNQPVRIAAINWYGFETTTFVAHGLWIADYKAILDRIKSSGFNTVRIPYSDQMLTQNPVLGTMNINRNGINTDIAANATALDVLDKIIAYCGQIGLRVMLDNHRSNAGNSAQENGLWFTNEFPESTWLANWRALTTRYLGNTTVVAMDLRNEPHASACWGGDPSGCSSANDWHAAATRAGNAILAINPNLLIVVEGNDHYNNAFTWWGGMLRGVASRQVSLNVANRVVYSAHDYGPTEANQPWFNGSATPASLNAVKDQNWGFIHNNNTGPIFVGEFGTLNTNADIQSTAPGSQGQWFSSTVAYLQGKPAMSHAYWAMNGNDRYALFNDSFNGIVNQTKLSLLQTIQFPLDQQPGNVPAISSVSPNSGLAGSSVTIAGSNFGTAQGTSVVRFNTTTAAVTAWSASQITVTVPQLQAAAYSVTTTVNGVSSNAATFTVTTATQPNYTLSCPTSLTVNRGASGSVTCTLTRTGGFTGSVAFTVSGLPAGVTASASPASTTGNSTVVTFTAGASATLGTANATISAAATGFTTRTAQVALTVSSGQTGGVVTATGAVASNSPWFAEEQVRLGNTATLTALTVTLTVARNPAALASSGQYNTIGGSTIAQSVSTTSTQVVYTFTLVAGQTLPAGTARTFAAQMSPGGSAHPTSGDSWTVTSSSGGSSTTTSGTF